jgi:hypothetical protein
LEVVVGLGSFQLGTNPLEVDFILHIGHHDERRNDTSRSRSLQGSGDLSVPDVTSTGQDGTNSIRRHGQQQVVSIVYGVSIRDPVPLGGVAQVLRLRGDFCQSGESVILALADGRGDTRLELVRKLGVATTQTERSDTALTILCVSVSDNSCALAPLEFKSDLVLTRATGLVLRTLSDTITALQGGRRGRNRRENGGAQKRGLEKLNHCDAASWEVTRCWWEEVGCVE